MPRSMQRHGPRYNYTRAPASPESPRDSGYGSADCLTPERLSFDSDANPVDYTLGCDGSGSENERVGEFPAKKVTPVHTPDRFVPKRDHGTPLSEKYRTTKHTLGLSSAERLQRHGGVTPDPFQTQASLLNARGSRSRPVNRHAARNHTIHERQVSYGTVWTVGGMASGHTAVDNGRGHLVRAGTNARFYTSKFPPVKPKPGVVLQNHEDRLACALEIDQATRILTSRQNLKTNQPALHPVTKTIHTKDKTKTSWDGSAWVNERLTEIVDKKVPSPTRNLTAMPFKVLDAPGLRDDYYCSALAYSPLLNVLAIGLGNLIYKWSEVHGVLLIHASEVGTWITSLSFSSVEGGKSILAFGGSDGLIGLTSMHGDRRFNVSRLVQTEDLLAGTEHGNILYYVVEWADAWEVARNSWPGSMTLVANIAVHTQQICALVWHPSGQTFASGANDNLCCLYDVDKVLQQPGHSRPGLGRRGRQGENSSERSSASVLTHSRSAEYMVAGGMACRETEAPPPRHHAPHGVNLVGIDCVKHYWVHGAAVKAIAFCPWQDGLIATGGGSNDKCIHFFHTRTATPLATISVSAQVTSLIWSTTRHEICATFGFAVPDHPYRVAVFSWPSCSMVGAIPWESDHRALYAVEYHPDFHNHRRGVFGARQPCIVIAASDKSIKFHEVWAPDNTRTAGGVGMLGGSEILEGLEGIYKEGDVIR